MILIRNFYNFNQKIILINDFSKYNIWKNYTIPTPTIEQSTRRYSMDLTNATEVMITLTAQNFGMFDQRSVKVGARYLVYVGNGNAFFSATVRVTHIYIEVEENMNTTAGYPLLLASVKTIGK